MAWKKGPLPKDTYNWGGVVRVGGAVEGFFFADFCGDHVKIQGDDGKFSKRLEADEIAYYDNCLELPIINGVVGRS